MSRRDELLTELKTLLMLKCVDMMARRATVLTETRRQLYRETAKATRRQVRHLIGRHLN
jgi:hypothetical protein